MFDFFGGDADCAALRRGCFLRSSMVPFLAEKNDADGVFADDAGMRLIDADLSKIVLATDDVIIAFLESVPTAHVVRTMDGNGADRKSRAARQVYRLYLFCLQQKERTQA